MFAVVQRIARVRQRQLTPVKILSLTHSKGKCIFIDDRDFQLTLAVLLHDLVKFYKVQNYYRTFTSAVTINLLLRETSKTFQHTPQKSR